MAGAALEHGDLDEVWFVPVFKPVHKSGNDLAPFKARVGMIRACLGNASRMRVCEVERELAGPSFTIRTLRFLEKRHPRFSFSLIIGGDSLRDLPTWKEAPSLASGFPFIVFRRPGTPPDLPLPNGMSRWIDLPLDGVASSCIRERLALGRVKGLPIHPEVAAQIVSRNLYGCLRKPFPEWLSRIDRKLKAAPRGIRKHIESVAFQAAAFSASLGEDPRLGYLAGLAHDLFRVSSDRELRRIVSKAGVRLLEAERETPMLCHALAAALFLKAMRPKVASEVVNAVRRHPFPSLRASRIGQALVLADTLDPSRGSPERDRMRALEIPLSEKYRMVVEYKRKKAEKKRKK